jgi:hypothetical protein
MTEEITAASASLPEHDMPTRPIRPATLAESAANFRPFRRRAMASLVAALPWLALGLAVFVEVVLVIIGAGFDLIFATGALAAALAFRSLNVSLKRFPQALAGLADRAALRLPGAEGTGGVETRLALFLEESESRFNRRFALAFSLIGLAAMATIFWPFQIGSLGEWAAMLARDPRAWLSLLFYVVVYALGFFAGALAWRPVALAWCLARLGRVFEFDLALDHPDGYGGLASLGELALTNALIPAGPALFFGGWALALSAFDPRSFVGLNALKLLFAGLGVLGGLLAMLWLFWPLWGVGRAMRRRRAEVRGRLVALDREIHRLSRRLLENAEQLDPAEGRAQDDRLEFLRRVYARNRNAPAWPVPGWALAKVFALQLVPLAGLVVAIVTSLIGR